MLRHRCCCYYHHHDQWCLVQGMLGRQCWPRASRSTSHQSSRGPSPATIQSRNMQHRFDWTPSSSSSHGSDNIAHPANASLACHREGRAPHSSASSKMGEMCPTAGSAGPNATRKRKGNIKSFKAPLYKPNRFAERLGGPTEHVFVACQPVEDLTLVQQVPCADVRSRVHLAFDRLSVDYACVQGRCTGADAVMTWRQPHRQVCEPVGWREARAPAPAREDAQRWCQPWMHKSGASIPWVHKRGANITWMHKRNASNQPTGIVASRSAAHFVNEAFCHCVSHHERSTAFVYLVGSLLETARAEAAFQQCTHRSRER